LPRTPGLLASAGIRYVCDWANDEQSIDDSEFGRLSALAEKQVATLAAEEAGGITHHVGAYQAEHISKDGKKHPIDWAGPVLVSNKLILLSSDGYAEAVSPYTGSLLGRVEIPGGTSIAPVVADDTLYILTNDAELVALK